MKKLSILLMVLVMAGGFAFAADIAVTGSATLEAVADLDNSSFGLDNSTYTGDISFALNLASGSGSAAGEGDTYAEIGISAGIDAYVDGYDADGSGAIDGTESAQDELNAWAAVDYARIISGDWTIGILGSPAEWSKAASYYDDDADGAVDDDDLVLGFGLGHGVTVSYQDYTIGADFDTAEAWALSAAGSFDLAEGVSVSAGAAFDSVAGVFLTAAADLLVSDITVAVAADMDLSAGFDFDLAASAVYDIVALNVYYGAELAAKVALDLDPISFSVDVRDILATQDINVSASTTVDAAAISAGFGYVIDGGAWDLNASVEYTLDQAVVTLGGSYASTGVVALNAGISSDSIIDGATVSLAYAGDDLTKVGADDVDELGKITAGVTISL